MSMTETLNYQKRYLELIEGLSAAALSWDENKILDYHYAG